MVGTFRRVGDKTKTGGKKERAANVMATFMKFLAIGWEIIHVT